MSLAATLFPPRTDLPADITTIDVMKTVALTMMIVDHIGWLLAPDIEWFRVVGRLCVPLWFFLIGYSRSRDVPTRWLAAGIILMISNIVVGLPAVPLVVLFTMALTRLSLDAFWRVAYRNPIYFWWMILLLIFLAYFTGLFVEYGTLGFLLAACGYAIRNRDEVNAAFSGVLRQSVPETLMIVVLLAYGILESMLFGFSMLAFMVVMGGLICTYFVLQGFVSRTLLGTSDRPSAPLYRLFGRYTLEIYVIHLLILKAIFALHLLAVYLVG